MSLAEIGSTQAGRGKIMEIEGDGSITLSIIHGLGLLKFMFLEHAGTDRGVKYIETMILHSSTIFFEDNGVIWESSREGE